MDRYSSLPRLCPPALAAAPTDDHRCLRFTPLVVAAALALFLLAGLTFSAGAAQAAFPGTNGLIACSGPLGPNPPPTGGSFLEIFTMNDSGARDASGNPTSQVRLQNNTASDFNPRFSRDGTQIAFVKDNNVWKMNANGTNEVQLTGLPPLAAPNINLDSFVGGWSPDGSKIVFQRSNPAQGANPANFEVFTINADGTGLTNVSNNPGSATVGSSDSQPSFSPDGTRIAFQSNRLGNPDIWVMNADGTGARPLTANSYAEESAPEFSPDGTKIAFQSDRGMIPRTTGRNLEIYRMNAVDGSDVTRLTFNDFNPAGPGGQTTANLSGFDLNPHWSPDGTEIVFHSGRGIEFTDAQWDAFTVTTDVGENPVGGTPVVRLTARALNDERCGWNVATPHVLLSVAKAGSGVGDVTASGINCGLDCAQGYAANTQVTLTAAPGPGGSTFDGFTGGGCSGAALTCTVTADVAKTVTATFTDPNPELTVTKSGSGARKAGTGTGTVTSSPGGIDCGADCSEEYASGTQVTLTAVPTPGSDSTFDGFTGGGCTGTANTCVVTVDAAKTVTAIFSGPLLTVSKTGNGAASAGSGITSLPFGVFCGTDCTEDFADNESVVLTVPGNANNAPGGIGVAVTGFTGCDSTTAWTTTTPATCTVAMSQARNVTVTFTDFPTLTVTKTGTGSGVVASAAGGLNCGTGAACTRDFAPGSTVTLTATPAAGSQFAGFAGCATTPTANTCTVTADAAKTVTASFLLIPRSLTVTKDGNGSGAVTSAPPGINCGADCQQDYDNGTSVTLTADPAAGSSFSGFSGGGCSGDGTTCTVAMTEARSVTATFALVPVTPPPPPGVTPPPPPPPAIPGATPARRSGSLSARVTPSRDLLAPFRFRTTGRLTRPSGITAAAGCNGRVSVQIKRGNTTISTRRVSLSSTCTFSSRVTFTSRRRFGSFARLKVTARFLGNSRILPDAAPSRFVRVRPL
jgi:Tol biopolymer transport system component